MANFTYPHYAVIRDSWTYYGGWDIFKITSEKRGIVYGSHIKNGAGSRISERVIKARFQTIDEANVKMNAIKEAWDKWEPEFKYLNEKKTEYEKLRSEEISKIVNDNG